MKPTVLFVFLLSTSFSSFYWNLVIKGITLTYCWSIFFCVFFSMFSNFWQLHDCWLWEEKISVFSWVSSVNCLKTIWHQLHIFVQKFFKYYFNEINHRIIPLKFVIINIYKHILEICHLYNQNKPPYTMTPCPHNATSLPINICCCNLKLSWW